MSNPDPTREYHDETLESNPCYCGHGLDYHQHADNCRFEDCTCKIFRENG